MNTKLSILIIVISTIFSYNILNMYDEGDCVKNRWEDTIYQVKNTGYLIMTVHDLVLLDFKDSAVEINKLKRDWIKVSCPLE